MTPAAALSVLVACVAAALVRLSLAPCTATHLQPAALSVAALVLVLAWAAHTACFRAPLTLALLPASAASLAGLIPCDCL